MNEADVESVFVEEGDRLGAMVLKFVSPGKSGVPDRIVLFPDGTHAFVELKAPGKKPRLLQQRVFAQMERMGHPVFVVDTRAAAREFWRRNLPRTQVRMREVAR